MAHFAACFGFGLAVEVQGAGGICGQIRDSVHVIADQVFHAHIAVTLAVAQRPACHGADMLFELARQAAVLCPVA